jgi:hypothetical protein
MGGRKGDIKVAAGFGLIGLGIKKWRDRRRRTDELLAEIRDAQPANAPAVRARAAAERDERSAAVIARADKSLARQARAEAKRASREAKRARA